MGSTEMDAFNQGSPLPALPALMTREADEGARDGLGASAHDAGRGFGGASLLPSRRRLLQRQKLPLSRTIAEEVVPLLVLAHRGPDATAALPALVEAAVNLLADIAVRSDVASAVTLIEDLHAAGHPLDMLYLDVIAGSARHLGQMWHDDKASFADVTIGVLALQRLLHALDHAFCGETLRRDPQRRLLLAARPGEPHGFALDMVSAFLRRAGWEVACLAPRDEQALCAAVRGAWYAVVGISDSCGAGPEQLAGVIHAVRRASRNRHVRVMVGGPSFSADPELAIRAGADATAADARHAVLQAEGLFALVRNDG
jgi:methanogenic corrinoid protein MtbC1